MKGYMHNYLTAEIPGIGGVIKEIPEDFLVTEVPRYLPCGDGEHVYVEIEKRGLTTLEAIRKISRSLNVSERDIGYAGMKDARGITRQTLSVPRIAPERLLLLELPGIRVLSAKPHRNKLKLGHLAGNLFTIRIRNAAKGALSHARMVLDVLQERGVPNYFGVQRYGSQGNSHLIGRALLRLDFKAAVDAIIGDPSAVRDERWRVAIEAYHEGDLEKSLGVFPGHCRTERDLVMRLLKQPGNYDKAFRGVHPRLKKLYLSAYQSALFDRLLDRRLSGFDRIMAGDLAYKHDNGACFLVEDEAAEAVRAGRFEISPSGPMFGCRMTQPRGEPLAVEEELLQEEGLKLNDFALAAELNVEGERRALRVPLGEPRAEMDGDDLLLAFSLPSGSYATSVLREIMKM